MNRTRREIYGDNHNYWTDKSPRGGVGNVYDFSEKQYGMFTDVLDAYAGVGGFVTLDRDALYNFSHKMTKNGSMVNPFSGAVLKAGDVNNVFRGAISNLNKVSKALKVLGPIGNTLAAGKIVHDSVNNAWDVSTGIDAVMLGLATFGGPIGGGIAIGYGILDYAFDINDKVDALVGRKAEVWK